MRPRTGAISGSSLAASSVWVILTRREPFSRFSTEGQTSPIRKAPIAPSNPVPLALIREWRHRRSEADRRTWLRDLKCMPLTRGDRPCRIKTSMWQTRHSMGDGVRPLMNYPVRGVDNSYSGGYRPRGRSFSFSCPSRIPHASDRSTRHAPHSSEENFHGPDHGHSCPGNP